MGKIKNDNINKLDVDLGTFYVRQFKKQRELSSDLVYRLLNISKNDDLSIRKELEIVYRNLGGKKANEFVDVLCRGCDVAANDLHWAIYSDVEKSSIPIEAYKAYTKAEKEMYEYVCNRATISDAKDEFDAPLELKIYLALFFRRMVDENKGLTYKMIHFLEEYMHGTEFADNLFRLAENAFVRLSNKLVIIKLDNLAVGKEFKEYLSSEEFLGKRKSLKR